MDRAASIDEQRSHYAKHGWAIVPKTLPLPVADALLYKFQQELGGNWEDYRGDYIKTFLTEKKSYECYSLDYSPMATLQYGLTPYMSTLVGKNLIPSHAYFRVYRKGDICHIHSDTTACEHALSLTLGYADDFMWPFNISEKYYDHRVGKPAETAQSEEQVSMYTVPLGVGDAVLYNGINYLHGRMQPNPNRWSAQIFLHWVDAAGEFADHAFDGRSAELVKRAEFVFPDDDAPEKINESRAALVETRGR